MQKPHLKKLLKTPSIITGNNKFKAFMNHEGYQDIGYQIKLAKG